jgi:hypothetical protein
MTFFRLENDDESPAAACFGCPQWLRRQRREQQQRESAWAQLALITLLQPTAVKT